MIYGILIGITVGMILLCLVIAGIAWVLPDVALVDPPGQEADRVTEREMEGPYP